MHVLVVRRTLTAADPELVPAQVAAFGEALRVAAADLAACDVPELALPWLPAFAGQTRLPVGGDPWTSGIEANRPVPAAMRRYARADGLADETLTVDAPFA